MVEFLSASGYLCESVTEYNQALEKIELYDYDCIILDLMLPGGSGLQLLNYLKQNKKSDGVIIISAKNSLEDKIEGINSGADDYLTKPFHLAELSVRIAAIIRRKKFNGQSVILAEDIEIDIAGQSVKVNQCDMELTQKEFQLLVFLFFLLSLQS